MADLPPGQRKISNFIIYRILGQPKIDIDKWRLEMTGMVNNRLSLKYDELLKMRQIEYVSDFHCVTGWTVEKVRWTGVSVRELINYAEPLKGVKWGYIHSADGYTTIVPYEDLVSEHSIIALKMNDQPLDIEHGYPARLFIPHLYGWKSAKWIVKIDLVNEYKDGYWEALGYHERGNIWKDERFKKLY